MILYILLKKAKFVVIKVQMTMDINQNLYIYLKKIIILERLNFSQVLREILAIFLKNTQQY
jgi:hypothetical protein